MPSSTVLSLLDGFGSLHKTPSGALCKQKDWIVKDDTEVSAVVAQAALQKRAAARSLSRLEPLHKKLRQTQVLRETWDAIAEHRKKWTSPALTCEEKTTNEVATGQKMDAVHSSTQPRAVGPDTAPPRLHTYICPYCAKSVQSPVATGRVDHRRGNGLRQTISRCQWPARRPHIFACMSNMRHGGALNTGFRPNSGNASQSQRPAVSHQPVARAYLMKFPA